MAVPQQAQIGDEQSAAPGVRPALARLLQEAGLVSDDQIHAAVAEGAQTGERFGEVLLRRGAIREEDLASLLARQWGLPFIENPTAASSSDPAFLPAERAREISAAALASEEGRPVVALADPSEGRFQEVRSLLGADVSFVVATQGTIERLLADAYPGAAETVVTAGAIPFAGPAGLLADARKSLGAIGEALELLDSAVAFAEEQAAELATARAMLSISELGRGDAERRFADLAAELEAERRRTADLEAQAVEVAAAQTSLADTERRFADLAAELEAERTRTTDLAAQVRGRDDLLAMIRAKLSDLQGALESQ